MNTMNTRLTAICSVPSTDWVMRSRPANARLAPGGRQRPWQRDTQGARSPRAGEAARWQRILDLLDPGKRCGAWSPATFQGRPVVRIRAARRRLRGACKRRNRVALARPRVLKLSLMGHHALRTRRRIPSDRLSGGCEIAAGPASPPWCTSGGRRAIT
jgi:hypothetical protein